MSNNRVENQKLNRFVLLTRYCILEKDFERRSFFMISKLYVLVILCQINKLEFYSRLNQFD